MIAASATASSSALIGGSYQTSGAQSVHEARALVSAIDGVHLINVQHDDRQLLYVFMHHGGDTHVIRPDSLVIDDAAYMLAAIAERMSLC